MLTLWGRTTSTNVQKVAWLIGELGLEVDRKDVGGPYGGLDTPEYITMNPNKLIPTLQDGSVTVWESEAVLRYLGAKYGQQYFPEDLGERAAVDKWMSWNQSTWFAPIGGLFVYLMKTPVKNRDSAKLKELVNSTNNVASFVDKQLENRPYLAGNQLSLADFSFASWLYRYFTIEIDRPGFAHLQKYYNTLCDRPMYVKHVHVDYEWMRVPGAERP